MIRYLQEHPCRAVEQPLMPDARTQRLLRSAALRSSHKPSRNPEETKRQEPSRKHSDTRMDIGDTPSKVAMKKMNSKIDMSPKMSVLPKSPETPGAANMQEKRILLNSGSRKLTRTEQRRSESLIKNAGKIQHGSSAFKIDKSILSPSTSSERNSLILRRRSGTSILFRLAERSTTYDGSKVGTGIKRTQDGDLRRESRDGSTRRTRRRYSDERNSDDERPKISLKECNESDRVQNGPKSEDARLRDQVERLNRELATKNVKIAKLEQDHEILRLFLAEKDATITDFKSNPSKLFVDVPNLPDAGQLKLPDESRRATETMRPAQFRDELEVLRIGFNSYREKVRNAVSMRKEFDERIRTLESEFDGGKLDIVRMERAAVQDELEIAKSLEKLYAAKVNSDALVHNIESKVVWMVVKSCREMQQITYFGMKLLAAWEEDQQKNRE